MRNAVTAVDSKYRILLYYSSNDAFSSLPASLAATVRVCACVGDVLFAAPTAVVAVGCNVVPVALVAVNCNEVVGVF